MAKLAYDEQQTLADTAAGLDMVQLSAAVGALAAARRIDIYGVGASGLVAQDLAQKLLRIGLIAHAHSDPHLAVTNAVQLRAKDVAVAITHSGSTGDVIEPLRVAFERGATTVAITGRPDGPGLAVRRPHPHHLHGPRERAAPGGDVVPDQPTPRRGLPVHRRGTANVRDGGPRALRLLRGPRPPPHPAQRQQHITPLGAPAPGRLPPGPHTDSRNTGSRTAVPSTGTSERAARHDLNR